MAFTGTRLIDEERLSDDATGDKYSFHEEKGDTVDNHSAPLPLESALSLDDTDFPDGGLRAWLVVVGVRPLLVFKLTSLTFHSHQGIMCSHGLVWILKLMGCKLFRLDAVQHT